MSQEWWRGCVIYQVYPRSFCDSNADGVGDIQGLISKLRHIADLGAEAIWLSPFFRSPMKDFGYDVSDYRDVDPIFGTLEDFQELIKKAHALDLKIMIDQVWSHSSDQHIWFKESRRSRDNDKADWYIWADPKADGTAPNNWLSYFGGPAWTWDSRREQYYLHHFLKEQPALNLRNPDVRQEIKNIAAYWLDMGVDGFRLDVAHTYLCDAQLSDNPSRQDGDPIPTDIPLSNPMAYQRRIKSMCLDENFEWIEELRKHVNQWPDRCLLAETGGDESEKLAATYVQTDHRFHLAYTFSLLTSSLDKTAVVDAIQTVESHIKDGWICWSVGNHDFKRAVSRVTSDPHKRYDAALYSMALGLTLRGSFCMYQGEELGLPQAELGFEDLVDPYDIMLYPEHVGRDGCRTPIPWHATAPHGGFSTVSGKTWLPVGEDHVALAADIQEDDTASVLSVYKRFLSWRKNCEALRLGEIHVLGSPDDIIVYERLHEDHSILCVFNSSQKQQCFRKTVAFEDHKFLREHSYNCSVEGELLRLEPYGYCFLGN